MKPTVYPVRIDGEAAATARALWGSAPSLPAGATVWIELNNRKVECQVVGVEFAVVTVRAEAAALASQDRAL